MTSNSSLGGLIPFAMMIVSLIYFYVSYSRDARRLRTLAVRLTKGTHGLDDRLRVLNAFVCRNQGLAKNERYFVLKRLGPTPVQILEGGGDCSDRSRLLFAMLAQIGIKASPAMLYPSSNGMAVHTVVLARTESGTVVADPLYDLMFPKAAGGYHDVHELMTDPQLLTSRLRALRDARGPADRICRYDEADHRYEFITTINWAKYRWLAGLAVALGKLGLEPRLIRRPAVLENPKLVFVELSGVGTVLFSLVAMIAR